MLPTLKQQDEIEKLLERILDKVFDISVGSIYKSTNKYFGLYELPSLSNIENQKDYVVRMFLGSRKDGFMYLGRDLRNNDNKEIKFRKYYFLHENKYKMLLVPSKKHRLSFVKCFRRQR